MINILSPEGAKTVIDRINTLQPNQQPLWGKMSADKMLAHCNVTYQFVYEQEKFKHPNWLMKFIVKTFIKKIVVGDKPYAKNSRTAPEFIITDERNFEKEKATLTANILRTQQLGEKHFDGLENFSFGKLSKTEWNTLFYKHLDHHLTQFGV
jgi:Protein of unknown function (DUF1569)